MPQGSGRTKALVQAGVYKMIVIYFKRKAEHEWAQDMTYEEIPAEFLRRTLWAESLKGRWRDPEDISVLETRKVGRAVFDLLKTLARAPSPCVVFGRQHGSSSFVCPQSLAVFQNHCPVAEAL